MGIERHRERVTVLHPFQGQGRRIPLAFRAADHMTEVAIGAGIAHPAQSQHIAYLKARIVPRDKHLNAIRGVRSERATNKPGIWSWTVVHVRVSGGL